jgi:hypothetical protein
MNETIAITEDATVIAKRAEAIRTLNHVTQPGKSALTYPADVYDSRPACEMA